MIFTAETGKVVLLLPVFILIYIFSPGKQVLYMDKDGWNNENVFSYTGEEQDCDMKFIRGNLALKDHLDNKKRLFLFENKFTGYV